MRNWMCGLLGAVCLALGLGVGLGVSFLRRGESEAAGAPAVIALVDEISELRTELGKNPNIIRVVDPRLFREALEARKNEPEMTRYRKACQEFGAKLLVDRELSNMNDTYWVDVNILDVDSGALLWTKSWSTKGRQGPNPTSLAVEVAEAVKKLADVPGQTKR